MLFLGSTFVLGICTLGSNTMGITSVSKVYVPKSTLPTTFDLSKEIQSLYKLKNIYQLYNVPRFDTKIPKERN